MMSSRRKVLVAADSVTSLLRELAADLRPMGVELEVLEARDGCEALSLAVAARPDLIFLPFELPTMAGPDVCRVLRGIEVTRDIPIIMLMTTARQARLAEAGFVSGSVDYVVLPVFAGELFARVQRHLDIVPHSNPPGGHVSARMHHAPR